jgi:hypothetical protein
MLAGKNLIFRIIIELFTMTLSVLILKRSLIAQRVSGK